MEWLIVIGIVVYILLGQFVLGLLFEIDSDCEDFITLILLTIAWAPIAIVYGVMKLFLAINELGLSLRCDYDLWRERRKNNE